MKDFFQNYKYFILSTFYIIIQSIIFCQINDNFLYGTLEMESQSSILDISDYLNLSLLLTSSGNIYAMSPFGYKKTIDTTLNASTSAAVYNENYIFLACTENYLFGKVNLETGNFEYLLNYLDYGIENVSNTSCCISILDNTVFVAISKNITLQEIENTIIKLNVKIKDGTINEPIIEESVDIKTFDFPTIFNRTNTSRDISCEIICEKNSNENRLLCIVDTYSFSLGKNEIYGITINSNMDNFEKFTSLYSSKGEIGFRLYKLDKYYLRLVLRKAMYDLYLDSSFNIKKSTVSFSSYESFAKLLAYSHNFLFTLRTSNFYFNSTESKQGTYLKINTFSSSHYLIYLSEHEGQKKLYNYYDENSDFLICLYQSNDYIRYISFKNTKEMYNIDEISYIYKVKSNEPVLFDIKTIFPYDFGQLYIYKLKQISTSSNYFLSVFPDNATSMPIDQESQIITLNSSSNLWYEFTFGLEELTESFLRFFILPIIKFNIQTCAFQCGSCLTDYYICDSCRDDNYASLEDSDDKNCYPINQIIEGYIYDLTDKKFLKCYSTCKFCDKKSSESSSSSHNCIACTDNFFPSYKNDGNCYKNENTDNDKFINIDSAEDESFSVISSCSSNYIIYETKECVDICPETIKFNSYVYTYVNFTEIEYGQTLPKQYELTLLPSPKYYLGKYCYITCPLNSEVVESTYECKCINAWHKDITTNIIECYDEDYCKYDGYKYYLSDTKECTNNCPTGYYQFNFQCYKNSDGCPSDTTLNSDKCESNYNYCYIDEHYQNQCSNEKNDIYIYNFDNSKQYLKECSESYTYTTSESKTYLYNGICYLTCPENTQNNNDKNICDCLYFGYYSETNENEYICYSENDKCTDYNQVPVNDLKKCLDSIDKCIEKGYKIFNNECFSEDCPENTEIKTVNDNYCLCKYYFYNDNNILDCYDSTITDCNQKDFEYSNPITKECFDSLEDCNTKGNIFYFNKYCYKDECPSQYIALSSIINETIKNDFITNLNIIDEHINRICICDIINTNTNWKFAIIDGVYSQECVNECEDEYEPNSISRRCIESCLSYKHYMFNNECYYDDCPEHTKLKEENGHICICENYFFLNNDDKLECYDSLEECQNNNLLYYNEEEKQCFSSIDNCISNNFINYFNKICYKTGCPEGKIALSSIDNSTIKDEFINYLVNSLEVLVDNICVCNTIENENLAWLYDSINGEQRCVDTCSEDMEEEDPEPITKKCVEKCNPLTGFIFNGICYKNNCPQWTKLKDDGSRNCECENSYYINDQNEAICCTSENEDDEQCKSLPTTIDCNKIENEDNINCIEKIEYPPEYYENPDKCLAVYNNTCYSKCPERTCLTQRDPNLIYCVNLRTYMTVFNDICFLNFEEIEYNVKNISDNNLYIIPSPNIVIKAYTKDIEINETNNNFSIVYLGNCENKLISNYHLPNNTILYILGVETPNKNKRSSVNVYNYGVYLENGTQLNLSVCEGEQLTIYSNIANSSLIKLEEANYFYSYGYDIYNESDNFYTDVCSPASINGNDITLSDRKIDFYPSNISMCNDSCTFETVDLEKEKIKCICDITYDFESMPSDEIEEEEYSYSYLEYFLSLFNYKIIFCQKLLLNPSNYLENIGFYVGGAIIFLCIINMFINMTLGIRSLNQIIIKNEPSQCKLKEKLKEKFKSIKNFSEVKTNDIRENKKLLYQNNNNDKREKKINISENSIKIQSNPVKIKSNTLRNIRNKRNKTEKFNKKKELKFHKSHLSANNFIVYKFKKENEEKVNTRTSDKKKDIILNKNNTIIYNSIKNKYTYESDTKLNLSKEKLNSKNIRKISFKICKNDDFEETKLQTKNYVRLRKSSYLSNEDFEESIDKKELNDVPYTKALRLDKRSMWEIFLYVFANKVDIINMFYYRDTYIHLSMSISLYLFEFLLDVTANCFLYTDDVVSQKYHNEGSLEMFTSLSLSFFSNIISSIITYFLAKLGDYSYILKIMTNDITKKKYYYMNIIKFRKYLKLRLGFFYFSQFLMSILMTYYIIIFCIIYSKSQVSIMINYLYGVLESFAISVGITLIITFLRYLSIKYKWIQIYRTSQFMYNRF